MHVQEFNGDLSWDKKLTDDGEDKLTDDNEEDKPKSPPFAAWEKGVGSKIMARMGFRQGTGLGAYSQGRIEPILVHPPPSKLRSLQHLLDYIKKAEQNSEGEKKKGSKKNPQKSEELRSY